MPARERRGLPYRQLALYLRNYPPNESSFTLNHLSEELDFDIVIIRNTVNKYRADSLTDMYLCEIPTSIVDEEESYNYALEQLHTTGLFLINPKSKFSGEWIEPTFRQFEDYNNEMLDVGFSWVKHRLEIAIQHRLEIPGIPDIRKFLMETLGRKRLLMAGTEDEEYSFSWDEIPGNDNGRFIDFLRENYIDWIITKIDKSDDGKIINVSSENNSLSLRLNNDKTKAILTNDDGKTDELIVKTENGRLNIYKKVE